MAKQPKLKTYVLIVSRFFPATHMLKGQPTNFPEMILDERKGHTVRMNYKYWKYVESQVNAGKGILSVRFWTGLPRRSDQQEFLSLNRINVQKAHVYTVRRSDHVTQALGGSLLWIFIDNEIKPLRWPFKFVARDGFNMYAAFLDWFKKPVEDAALIHFNPDFKY